MPTLYPDQQETIEKVAQSMRRGNQAVLMQGSTGSGKSVMASELVRRAYNKGSQTMFIVPRRDLLRQMHETFNAFELTHSYIAAGHPLNPHAKCHIASSGTLINRLDRVKPPDLAIIDETHIGGKSLNAIVKWLRSNNTYVIGLSATPWRLDGTGLGCWYDDMQLGPSLRELIDMERLSDYRAFAPSSVDLTGVHIRQGDYAKGQLADKMENSKKVIGDAVQHYKKHAYGKRCVAYCVSVKHSEITAQAFHDAGVPAAHIDGSTSDDERKRKIRAFARRELLVLTNCELLTTGFDLALQVGEDVTVECMSDLRPTKSLALQMQKWGRTLRYKDEPALIFDHSNNMMEHGLPDDDREWTLKDRKQKRNSSGEAGVAVRQCERCFFCHHPAPVCPNCGYVYPSQERTVDEVEGELEEVRRDEQRKQRRKERAYEESQCETLSDWQALARKRGYSMGWAWIRYNKKKPRA
jgi:superfamily II DNA or RNA helicase